MFYSPRKTSISSDFSHLEFDRIFCGQYWDEMCCAGFLGPVQSEQISVLMLGLADGAAIRPIFSSGRVKRLVGVDICNKAVQQCRKIYDSFFPEIHFETATSEAKEYLEKTEDVFDVIIVDIYLEAAYSHLVFDECFHSLLKKCVNRLGHIIFNAYGLPMHLRPFEGNSPQAYLAYSLHKSWDELWYLPYRRNATIIIGPKPTSKATHPARQNIKAADELFLKIMSIRILSMQEVLERNPTRHKSSTEYLTIDLEMRKRWTETLPYISERINSSVKLLQPGDLRKLLAMPDECRRLQQKLTDEKHPLSYFLPILVAGEINCSTVDARWLIDWVTETIASHSKLVDAAFISIILPQTYAVIINGSNRYLSQSFEFRRATNQLLNDTPI